MTGRREPRTVQFVFKASPEEEITRSVITTSSAVHHHDHETLVNNSEQQKLGTVFNNNLNESPNHVVYPIHLNKALSVQVRTVKPLESNKSNQISNTESPLQYRARDDVVFNESIVDKSRECESVVPTRQSNINVVERLARHFEEEQQKAAGLLTTKQDGGEEDAVNNVGSEASFSKSTTNSALKLDLVKTISKERVSVYQINHVTASSPNSPVFNEKSAEDLEIIKCDHTAESEADVTALAHRTRIQVSSERNNGGENEKLFQNDSQEAEKRTNNSSNETVRDILHVEGVRESSSSVLSETAVKSENDSKVVPTKRVHHILSKAHWYQTDSLITEQQLVSPSQGTSDSPLPPVKPPPPALPEPNLRVGNNLSQTRHRGDASNGLPNHVTRLQEYKLPHDFGNKEFKSSRPEFYLERNDVGYYYPNTRNENFPENSASRTPENNSIKSPSSEINQPSSLFHGRNSRPQRKIDSSVDLEYYDINSDQELNSMITRRRTKSLNNEEKFIEYVTPTKRESTGNDNICYTVGNDVTQKELEKDKLQGRSHTMSLQSTCAKPSHVIKDSTRSFDKSYLDTRDQVYQYPQHLDHTDSKTNFYRAEQDNSGLKKNVLVGEAGQRHERDHALFKVGHFTGNHVPGKMEEKFLRNNYFARQDVPVKTLDYARQSYSNAEGLNGVVDDVNKTPGKILSFEQYCSSSALTQNSNANKEDRESRTSKSIPVKINMLRTTENVDESNQGSYNIREAEAYWNELHEHIGNNLPRTTHKDGISNNVPHNESFCDSKNDSYSSIDLDFRRFANEDKRRESHSTSSLITTDSYDDSDDLMGGNDFTGVQSKEEFKTTLKQLSRYVLAGYKENLKKSLRIMTPRKKMLAGVETQRYHLDEEEAELSEVKEQANDFNRLSMVANVISRLREIYTVILLPKPSNKDSESYAKHFDNGRGKTLLCDAIDNQPMSEVKKVILSYSNVDVNLCSQSGYSSLHKAAEEGDIEGLRFLIEHGADLNARDRSGFPPVHNALQRYHYKAAIFLMDCGTDMMSYTSKRIQEFLKVKATAKQFLRQNLKTRL